MQFRRVFPFVLLTLVIVYGPARSQEPSPRAFQFTLQVAAFPDRRSTEACVLKIKKAGEEPVWGSVNIPGRGIWFRVYIGEFATSQQARLAGASLKARGIIKEYLVKRAGEIELLGRVRRIGHEKQYSMRYESRPLKSPSSFVSRSGAVRAPARIYPTMRGAKATSNAVSLPGSSRVIAFLTPFVDTSAAPMPDPVRLAFRIIAGEEHAGRDVNRERGGLWLTGDVEDAMARLQWIVGPQNAQLLSLESDGRLKLDAELLPKLASAFSGDPASGTLQLADYISSNEGLLLVVQMAKGEHRYLLHIGEKAPARGTTIKINGSVNLDNNFDSRINPYRRDRIKLNQERPPAGFDSMIAINPVARWVNLRADRIVPVGHITFHEMAEAYAKVTLGLDYLSQGVRPGAHNIALEREKILKSQRPGSDIVLTMGSNRVLKSNQEIRQLYVKTSGPGEQR
jgi:hypothetical protein